MSTARHVDTATFRQIFEQPDVVLVDVRSPGEFASVHVDGSHNLPLDVLQKRAADVVERLHSPVVLLCAQGVRSEQAAGMLRTAGAADIHVLDGGIRAWESDGGDVVRGAGRWAMDRQVRLVAGSLVLTGVLISLVAPKAKWLAAAVGGGLTFSALSNTCAMGRALGYLPYNRSVPGFDSEAALLALLARLTDSKAD
jgi:rhodanese-related sulfurtransferase